MGKEGRIAMISIENAELTSPAFQADPYPTYARWRAEAPVCRVKMPDKQRVWIVTSLRRRVDCAQGPALRQRSRKGTDGGAGRPVAVDAERGQTAVTHDAQPGRARPYPAAGPGTQGIHARAGREHARAYPDAD